MRWTPVNTGRVGGVVRLIEIYLEGLIQWLICRLHVNELPFKHKFEANDGETSAQKIFKVTIGNKIENVSKLVDFELTNGNLEKIPEDIVKQISIEQNEICISIKSGNILISLAKKPPDG